MEKKSVIIIGAGLAGLSTGIYAQMNGVETHIFEHAARPGGVAATWKRRGYTIDGGIHFYMGHRPGQSAHKLYRDLGVYQPEQYLPMRHYGRYLDLERHRSVDVTQDLERLERDLIAISARDSGFIRRFFKGVQAFSSADLSIGMQKPPELSTWWDSVKMVAAMGKRLKYYWGDYMRPVNQVVNCLHDSWLKTFFDHLFFPQVPLSFLMMVLGALAGGNMARRADGSAGFARAMEKRYLDLGGKVTYRATVDEIVVKNDRAVGIRLADQEVHRADYVISAGDGHSTIFKLLKGRYVNQKIKDLYEKWPLFKPVVVLNFGVDRQLDQWPSFVVFKPKIGPTAGFLTDDWFGIRIFNYAPGYAPEGNTLIQLMIDSAWDPWKALRQDKAAYEAQKQLLSDQIKEALNDIWPGIAGQVNMTDVATPYTWWRYTLNRRGAYEGFAITPQTFTFSVERSLPGLSHFYMAGQWTIPGGGVVPSMITGRQAVMLLCHREKKKFRQEFNG